VPDEQEPLMDSDETLIGLCGEAPVVSHDLPVEDGEKILG